MRAAGLTMWVPPGWHSVDRKLTPCTNPVERLTIAGPDGGFVHVQESLDPPRYVRRFPRRPPVFHPRGRPSPLECCAPTRRPGWLVYFRDRGRAFYAYLYGTSPRARTLAFQALSSLRVEPR